MHTTIKVSMDLRDRLKAQAAGHGRTIGEHLAVLADEADRETRFARLRRQIAETPAESMAEYRASAAAWAVADADGLPDEDFRGWPGHGAA